MLSHQSRGHNNEEVDIVVVVLRNMEKTIPT
jgi:hypothetical protein